MSDDLHATIERTCSDLYDEIELCSAASKQVAETSPAAAAELAPLEDGLRLALLDITELSTQLYAIHSGRVEVPPAIARRDRAPGYLCRTGCSAPDRKSHPDRTRQFSRTRRYPAALASLHHRRSPPRWSGCFLKSH